MKSLSPSDAPSRGSRALGIGLEACGVLMAGLVLGLVANRISPGGLALTRDYFPGAIRPAPALATATNLGTQTASTSAPIEQSAARIRQRGLGLVDSNQVAQLFHDPRYAQGLIVFVDARDDPHYQAGHIPGAYQLDHYHAQNYLPTVLPACLNADKAVVYCRGGSCEDSEFAAVLLRDAGVAAERLSVYIGGINEWMTNGWPIELGQRNSGQLRAASP